MDSLNQSIIQQTNDTMVNRSAPALHTIPDYLIRRIMNNLGAESLVWSLRGVCARINTIMDSYEPYTVYSLLTSQS